MVFAQRGSSIFDSKFLSNIEKSAAALCQTSLPRPAYLLHWPIEWGCSKREDEPSDFERVDPELYGSFRLFGVVAEREKADLVRFCRIFSF